MSPVGNTTRLKLSKREKLRHSRQFKEIYIWGRSIKGPHLTILCKPNQLPYNRLGLSVSKKRFKLSARRHYIQRRLREIYRLNKMRLGLGWDIVIRAHSWNDKKTSFADIEQEFLALAQKARLAKE